VNELFSMLKSAEVDRGMTTKLEGPTDSHSLALVGSSKGKGNTNSSTRMFSLSSLMSMPDEEFDVLGEDELALLTRRFKSEGPKRRTRERGSEWEPIKILFKNSAYEPDFTHAPPQASLAKFM
jgi:hypothetical protein